MIPRMNHYPLVTVFSEKQTGVTLKVLQSHPDIFESQHKMFSVKYAIFKKRFWDILRSMCRTP